MKAVIGWLTKAAVAVIQWAVAYPVAAAIAGLVIVVTSALMRASDSPAVRTLGYILPITTNLFIIAGVYGYGARMIRDAAVAVVTSPPAQAAVRTLEEQMLLNPFGF